VDDIMHTGERLPVVGDDVDLATALLEITRKGMGMTAVVDPDGRLAGIFTDGDLRRALDQAVDVRHTPITEVMTRDPVVMEPGHLAAEALQIMEERKINGLLVLDAGRPVGALNMHDLLRAGVV
jgi:arabinose-5-phosphate isomerase